MPGLDQALNYYTSGTFRLEPGLFRAENRGEVNNRLLAWTKLFESSGIAPRRAAILAAVLGELGNNSFDHNLGNWKDEPGCLIGIDVLTDRVRLMVADRGQGIANSLRRVRPDAQGDAELLKAAFEEVISGRSPERRGNGLKFIRKNFFKHGGISLVCLSAGAQYRIGDDSQLQNCLDQLNQKANQAVWGTFTAIDWSR